MTESKHDKTRQDADETRYRRIADELQAGGYRNVSAQDVAVIHQRLRAGREPADVVGKQIADALRRALNTEG